MKNVKSAVKRILISVSILRAIRPHVLIGNGRTGHCKKTEDGISMPKHVFLK